MDIQYKDNLVLGDNILKKIDEIEYQKYIKIILEITYTRDLDKDTFFHAVDILKRYINIDYDIDIHLLSITSIYIASKFNDCYYLNLKDNFSSFDNKKIINSERDILNKLNFDIYKPNVYTYYCYIQNNLNYKNTPTEKLSLCILEYFSTDLDTMKFPNCIFAISAIQISYTLVEYKRNIHEELKELNYNIKEIETCIEHLKNKFYLLGIYVINNIHFRIKYLIILQFINKWVTL